MSENGNETVEMSTPEITTPATTNNETGNTRKGNRQRKLQTWKQRMCKLVGIKGF